MKPGSVAHVTDGALPAPPAGDVVVVIPAYNEAARIGAAVRAAKTLPAVRSVLVVDDGSSDGTAAAAVDAGSDAVAVLRRNKGKGAAMAAGAARAFQDGGCRYVLFLDADLGETAGNAGPLIEAVRAGDTAMAVARVPAQPGGGHGFVVRLARDGVKRACGFEAEQPLSGQRCMTREAFEAALPLARRFGVEVGLTIDLVRVGFSVAEVPADLRHRVTGTDRQAQLHRARQYRDVAVALAVRRLSRLSAFGAFTGLSGVSRLRSRPARRPKR